MSATTAEASPEVTSGWTAAVRRRPSRRPLNFPTIIIWVSAAYFVIPLLWLGFASTKSTSGLFSTFGLWFGDTVQFSTNVRATFQFDDGIFGRWLFNSAYYAVASAVGAAALATTAGYALAIYQFPGKALVRAVVLSAIMVPATALAIPTYLVFAAVGLTNTPWAIILPSIVNPFAVFLMLEYSRQSVDRSLLEAARLDGAGDIKIFLRIAMPILRPGIATVLLFTTVATFNNYFLPLIMLNNDRLFPVTVGLAAWQASGGGGGTAQPIYELVMTGSVLATLPLVATFLLLQRYWQSGLTTGAVK